MADVIFCQIQDLFGSEVTAREARLIVYEDDAGEGFKSFSPFLFEIGVLEPLTLTSKKTVPVGINCYGYDGEGDRSSYGSRKKVIEKLLEEELQKVDVVLYTTQERFKEAFYNDFQETMRLNTRTTDEKEIMYWSYCGKDDRVLLVAFEDLLDYQEGFQYLKDNYH